MIWRLAFEKKPFQFWREIWIQVVVILLQLYLQIHILLPGQATQFLSLDLLLFLSAYFYKFITF